MRSREAIAGAPSADGVRGAAAERGSAHPPPLRGNLCAVGKLMCASTFVGPHSVTGSGQFPVCPLYDRLNMQLFKLLPSPLRVSSIRFRSLARAWDSRGRTCPHHGSLRVCGPELMETLMHLRALTWMGGTRYYLLHACKNRPYSPGLTAVTKFHHSSNKSIDWGVKYGKQLP